MTITNPGQPLALNSPIVPQLSDRRAGERVQTVFRVARIIAASDQGLARIRNMSDHGARLRVPIPVAPSDTLTVELADGVELVGQVVWNESGEFGLQFGEPIDCAGLLATLAAGARSGTTRPVRLPVATTALIRSERGLRCARIIDISQRGLKLLHDGSLTEGLLVKVTLSSGLDRLGTVRWARDKMAGVMLLEPLSVETLGSVQTLVAPPALLLQKSDPAGGTAQS
jgi:hypothetical protein